MSKPVIGLVGPCGAGKSTLAVLMRSQGYTVKHIAQEHSYVPYMWQRIGQPDILIYLDVSYEKTLQRRPMNWTPEEYTEQLHRLRHAREHASLYILTDDLTPDEVLQRVTEYLLASPPPLNMMKAPSNATCAP